MNAVAKNPLARLISITSILTLLLAGCGGGGSEPNPPSIESFTVNPLQIDQGQDATLSWTSLHATQATIDQGIGTVDASGSTTVSPQLTTTYTLTVSNPDGSDTAQVTLTCTKNDNGAKVETRTRPTDVVEIAVGSGHTCSLWNDGLVRCWGNAMWLGDGTFAYRPAPTTPVKGVTDASAIAAAPGNNNSCAVQKDGIVRCWGNQRQAAAIVGLTGVTDVTVGYRHYCALLADHRVKCWGENNSGQLGIGSRDRAEKPTRVKGLDRVREVAAGGEHTCARTEDGAVWCWGNGWSGAVGSGLKVYAPAPVKVAGLSNVMDIDLGFNHSCAVRTDGAVLCWGDNDNGQLGDGTRKTRGKPVRVVSIRDAVAVAVGMGHSCARLNSGALRCWGGNYSGQLGDETVSSRTKPVAVRGYLGKWKMGNSVTASERRAVKISAGPYATCALSAAGDVACWGDYRISPLIVIPQKTMRTAAHRSQTP